VTRHRRGVQRTCHGGVRWSRRGIALATARIPGFKHSVGPHLKPISIEEAPADRNMRRRCSECLTTQRMLDEAGNYLAVSCRAVRVRRAPEATKRVVEFSTGKSYMRSKKLYSTAFVRSHPDGAASPDQVTGFPRVESDWPNMRVFAEQVFGLPIGREVLAVRGRGRRPENFHHSGKHLVVTAETPR